MSMAEVREPVHAYVVRIELTAARRRHLGTMAKEAGTTADELAAQLLSDVIDDDEAAHAKAKKEKAPPAPSAPPTLRKRKMPKVPDDTQPIEANGITVDLVTRVVTHGEHSIEVSLRQGQLVAVLAQAMPALVPRDELFAKAWPDLSPSSGKVYFSELRGPLTLRLGKVGLTLVYGEGVGLENISNPKTGAQSP